MLRISGGYSPEYLLREVATGRENYYTGAVAEGEPPGRWWGAGAEKLGLTGLVDPQTMRGLYERFLDPRHEAFSDPARWDEVTTLGHTGRAYLSEDDLYAAALEREPNATAERRTELRTEAGKKARHNVAFLDVTFSVQKSVTLLHTAFEAQEVAARTAGDEQSAQAWAAFRLAVEDAIWVGNNAGLAYLAEHAGYARIGHHGGAAGRFVDAHDWVVASFFQHDSRDHDPQLHVHNPVLNRVQGPDGVWRTLDSRAIHRFRAGAGAVAERTTEERLSHTVGALFAMRVDGKAREIVGVSAEAMSLISTRRHKVTAKTAELVDAFEARYGRAPNGLERDRFAQQATLLTRAAKSHTGETREELLDRIDRRLRAEVADGLGGVAQAALAARGNGPTAQEWSPQAVIETALEEVQQRKSGWNRSDLTRAMNAALPDYLGIPDGEDVAALLDLLTEEALRVATPLQAPRPGDALLPDELRLANGQSAYQGAGAQLYATPEQVHIERDLVAATAREGGAALPAAAAQRFLDGLRGAGVELGVDQAAAVHGVLTSGARVETLVGPAGTGKSFVVGALAKAWSDPALRGDQAGRVFGLATSQVATDVLAAEGLTARNVARWLATQDRLAAGPGSGGPRAAGDDLTWQLRAGDLVVVDESAMTDTAALAAVHRHVDAAGAKLLLVGDHRQLAAIGAGGGMDLLAAAGSRYELAEARRFTAGWEREASLRLRDGDETVLRDYHQHGRLLDSGSAEQAESSAAAAWLGDTLAGRRSMLLVDTNEQAARLSAQLRAELVRLGRVDEGGVRLGLQGTYAGVGDLVQARRNGWELAGHEGNRRGPVNRETYRVTAVRDDGALEVAVVLGQGDDGEILDTPMVLPAGYVAEHLALGYASTVHAAQGATVDTSHTVVTSQTGPAALYVGMSRGRDTNTAHVATVSGAADPAQGGDAHSLHRDPTAVLAGILDQQGDSGATRSALAVAAESAQESAAVRTPGELLADAAQLAATERTARWLDRLVDDDLLTGADRARIAAEDGTASLARVLRRAELAGHQPEQVLRRAVAERPLDGARNATHVLYARLSDQGRFDPVGESWAEWTPHVDNPEWRDYLAALAAAADLRTQELGRDAAEQAPSWAVEAFGPVPAAGDERDVWEAQAGVVAGYRELAGHDGDVDALGPAPRPGEVEAYAAYRAAWRTLGRPEIDREEAELSDGQLRVRVRAWEREKPWAPRYVGNELAGTRQAADHQHRTAAVRQAEAIAAADPEQQERLAKEAADAAELARVLDDRAEELQQLDDARAQYLAHTAETRSKAERAAAALAERHAADVDPEPVVTAEEWLAAQRAADADDERRWDQDDEDVAGGRDGLDLRYDDRDLVVESDPSDLRDVAANEPAPVHEDVVRVPTATETADAVAQASRAIAEIRARQVEDEREDVEERAAELNHWREHDRAAGLDDTDDLDAADDTSAHDFVDWDSP